MGSGRGFRQRNRAVFFPFHGGDPLEKSGGGAGIYAGLVNLLSTAVGSVSIGGTTLVRGQQTSEFTAMVEPLKLIEGLTAAEVETIERQPISDELELFVTEAGLPIKVVSSVRSGSENVSETTEILAVDVPVAIKPPPARETTTSSISRRKAVRAQLL